MMPFRFLTVLLISLGFAITACGQKKNAPVSKPTTTQNPFQQVAVPDSVLQRINHAIKRQEKLEADAFPLYIFNLIDRNKFTFQDGIYSYRLSSPHASQRIFIVYKGATTIFNSIYIDDLLTEYSNFLKNRKLPTKTSITYLKVISIFLEQEYDSEHEEE